MNYETLDKRAVLSWRIGRCISFVLLALFFTIVLLIVRNIEALSPWLHYIYLGVALILLYKLIGIIIFPAIEFRQWRYIITEEKVEFRHGIFYLKTTVIPIVRIQHITITRGPIYRKLGLSTVKLSLASGSFSIEGLNEKTADRITEYLKSRVYQRLNPENNEK